MNTLNKIAKFLTAASKVEFIDLLNKDLELEYSAAIQYINHSALIDNDEVISELKIHAREEIEHAMELAHHIKVLGGKPAIGIGQVYEADTTKAMLNFDLQEEQGAIDRYTERVKQAEDMELFECAKVLGEILAKEQEHATDIKKILSELKR